MLLNKFFRSKFNSGDTKREYEINIATDYVTSKTTYINTVASSVLVSRTTSYTTSWNSYVYRTTGVTTSKVTAVQNIYCVNTVFVASHTASPSEGASSVFELAGSGYVLAPGRSPQSFALPYKGPFYEVGTRHVFFTPGVNGYLQYPFGTYTLTNSKGSTAVCSNNAAGDVSITDSVNKNTSYYTSWSTLIDNVPKSRTTSYTTSWYSTAYRTTGYVTSMTTLKNTVKKIIIEDENSMNILMLGNFYLGNNIGPTLTYLANENVKELTIDGTLVRASTPGNNKTLPAGTVTKSNISGMLGDSLLEDTSYNSINIFNISTNGFYTNANNNDNISSWHKSHPVSTYSNSNDRFVYSKRNLFERIEFARNKLNINNAFTHIVVALQDNNVLETNIETIKLKYMQLFLDLKSIGIDGTIVLLRKGNANYIEAQNQLIAENDFIVEGPDLSTVLESDTTTPITIANSIKDSIITSMNFV